MRQPSGGSSSRSSRQRRRARAPGWVATVYGIVKQSGGHIGLTSEPGKGTTFHLYLPRAAGPLEAAPIRPTSGLHRVGGERILLVEDEPALRALAERMLKGMKCRVTTAANGDDALAAVKQNRAKPDLLITDLVMPGMGGKALAQHLLRLQPGLRILFVSGYTDQGSASAETPTPGAVFLQKPFSISSLAAAARESLENL